MAETTTQQSAGRRLGLLVRAVPRIRRRVRPVPAPAQPGPDRLAARAGVLSLHLDLAVGSADDAAVVLERVLGVLRPGDRVYVAGPPGPAEPQVDDRPFTIWA